MPPTTSAERVLTIPGPALSREAVGDLARQISPDAASVEAPIVIDCHNIRDVSPTGLSALIDLRADHERVRFALVALSKPMLAAALELGLSERFTICVSVEAAHRTLRQEGG